MAEVTDLQGEVVSQQARLDNLRNDARRELDALALKLGEPVN